MTTVSNCIHKKLTYRGELRNCKKERNSFKILKDNEIHILCTFQFFTKSKCFLKLERMSMRPEQKKKVDNLSTAVLFDIGNPYLPSKRLCILSAFNFKAGLDYGTISCPFFSR